MIIFQALMIATFIAALITLALGVGGMGSQRTANTGNKLMTLRVALCIMLLVEILIYHVFIK